ncbi:MAG: hypothetical protein EBR99_05615 [Actinobacteria bacterium]|nr:hypothetical protein [Actinomycetota bacterium]
MTKHVITEHPREKSRAATGPIKTHDQMRKDKLSHRINGYLAVKITGAVGTMWCAYLFALLALLSLPEVIRSGSLKDLVAWIAQTFLQLVLLSIIIVGQNISQVAADKRAEETFEDVTMSLDKAREIQAHLIDQDKELETILAMVKNLEAQLVARLDGQK